MSKNRLERRGDACGGRSSRRIAPGDTQAEAKARGDSGRRVDGDIVVDRRGNLGEDRRGCEVNGLASGCVRVDDVSDQCACSGVSGPHAAGRLQAAATGEMWASTHTEDAPGCAQRLSQTGRPRSGRRLGRLPRLWRGPGVETQRRGTSAE